MDRDAPLYGILTTGGRLLFAADTHRRFYAMDRETGDVLRQTILNGVSDLAPISYSVNGRQYIEVNSPGGTTSSSDHVGKLNARGPVGLRNVGHTLYVFALPEG